MTWTIADPGLPPIENPTEVESPRWCPTDHDRREAKRLRAKAATLRQVASGLSDIAVLLAAGSSRESREELHEAAEILLSRIAIPKSIARAHGDDSPTVALDNRGEPETLTPREWWPKLTGEEVGMDGKARCPNPDHPDTHPSCKVYAEHGQGWYCPVCQTGGTALNVAALVTGIRPRGQGYWRLREWIEERL